MRCDSLKARRNLGGRSSEQKIDKILYTVEEVARILNLKLSRVRMAIFRKEITYVKLGALVRFREEDIKKFVNINLVPGQAF